MKRIAGVHEIWPTILRCAAMIRLGKEAFYAQVEQPIARAYAVTSEAMACNMLLDDASEGIDAFLEKRAPAWQGSTTGPS